MRAEFLDNLFTIPFIHKVLISPDGKSIVFNWQNINRNVEVYYLPSDGSSDPIQLTQTNETTNCLSFYPNSKSIIVAEDRDGNERYQLFRVDLKNPNNLFPITIENPPYFLRGGQMHPNEKWLVFGANYSFEQEKEIEATNVFRQDTITGEIICLANPSKATWLLPKLSKNGDFVLYNRKEYHPKGSQLWLVDIEGKEDKEILNFGEQARVNGYWLPDSKRVVFTTDSKSKEAQSHYSVGIYNIETENIEWIIDDPSRNVENIYVPYFGNHIIAREYNKGSLQNSIIDLADMSETVIPRINGNLAVLAPYIANSWIGVYYSSTQPADIVHFNIDDVNPEKFKSLTKVWSKTNLKKADLSPAQDFDWKSDDNLSIHGWLYNPRKPNGKTIIFVHGGPTQHSVDYITPEIQYYVHNGFTVLDPNYRGSTGYGVDFENAIRKNGWGSDEQIDIWKGIESLIEQGLAKEGKVGITGTSYGGYSAWIGITKAPTRLIAAAAPICGMTDLVLDYQQTRPDIRRSAEQMMGGSPDEVPGIYYERSPLNFTQNIKGQLLIIQGAKDPNVTMANVTAVEEKLKENNIKYEKYVFEDEGHGIVRKENKKLLTRLINDFFDKSL